MKRDRIALLAFIGIFILATILVTRTFAQQVGRRNSGLTGSLSVVGTTNQEGEFNLTAKLLVEDFEMAGEWSSYMPRDYGVTMAMRREGAPESLASESNRYVLGVKVEFMRRDFSWVTMTPAKPTAIKGITKSLSVWVVGRNYQHMLSVILRDYLGRIKFLQAGKLTWAGWKEVSIPIPPSIEQDNYKITDERGVTFEGFRVDFQPEDMMGRPFYIYFDWLTSDTDIFVESFQNPDDMLDNW